MARLKKDKLKKGATVHGDLEGLDLKINEFGEIVGNIKIEEINTFLNKHVSDIKLEDRSGEFGEESKTDREE